MKLSHIEHLGIAVKSIEAALPFYEKVLGMECYAVEEVADQKVKTAFLKIGQTKIELLESTDPEGPVGKFIEKKGEGIHHLAVSSEDVVKDIEQMKEKDVRMIDETPRGGAHQTQIAFIHPKETRVLVELTQQKH